VNMLNKQSRTANKG